MYKKNKLSFGGLLGMGNLFEYTCDKCKNVWITNKPNTNCNQCKETNE